MKQEYTRISEILKQKPIILSDREKLKAFLFDCFPGDRLHANLLLIAYDSGICNYIKEKRELNDVFSNRFIHLLTHEYGIKEEYAHWSVFTWAEVYGSHLLGLPIEITQKNNTHHSEKNDELIIRKKVQPSKPAKAVYSVGDTIFENKDIEVVYRGIYRFNGLFAQGYRIKLIVNNKTSHKLWVQCENITVNGLVVEQTGLVESELSPNKRIITSTLMDQGKLAEANATSIPKMKTIEFVVGYRDSEKYSDPLNRSVEVSVKAVEVPPL